MNNANNKRKVLKRIKWENIFTIIGIIFDIICIVKHIQLNGYYNNLIIELFIYFGFTLLVRYIVKDIRLNTKEYTSIFFE